MPLDLGFRVTFVGDRRIDHAATPDGVPLHFRLLSVALVGLRRLDDPTRPDHTLVTESVPLDLGLVEVVLVTV